MQKGIDYVGVGVCYFCHDGNGRYLMNKRGKNCRDERGCWDFGGGAIEFGKTVEEALGDELREEYCVENFQSEYLGYRDIFREQDRKRTHWLQFDFRVLVDPKEAKNGEPHKFDTLE